MALADAARRLLRSLSLSQSSTAMMDLQRDGPAVDRLWCADGAGTDSSTSTSTSISSSFELELWPSASSISRRPTSSSSSAFTSSADPNDGPYYSPTTRGGIGNWESGVRLRIGAASPPHLYTLDTPTPKTIPAFPAPHIRRADSFDSIASSVSSGTSSCSGSSVSGSGVSIRNIGSGSTVIGPWAAESADTRRRTAGDSAKRRTKKGRSSEASDVLWRGYWD
ncbi:hypothetical protein GGR51DRAFT_560239 [Nemania sp. FL0031]|nr:hypothetical protein GGR51DRAFT_560239 [Nemania sp. FL0031]